jgi:hypothetical protein
MVAVYVPAVILLGVKVTVVFFAVVLSLELTVPETELLELSVSVKVLVVRVDLSTTSLKVAEMLEIFEVIAPLEGEVEETVGAVLSIPPFVPAIIYLSKESSFLAHEYTNSRISTEIRFVFIIDLSEKETDTK